MRSARFPQLAILVILAAALACGESRETPAPAVTPEQPAPAAEAPPPPRPAAETPAPPPPAPSVQPASIQLEIFAEGSPEAASGGRGTLNFGGQNHPLVVSGVSLSADAGVPRAEMVGQVTQLARVEDIAGTYSASAAGAVLGGSPKIAQLENPKGVGLKLLGKQLGGDVKLDLNGMQISLAQ